jgi:anti-sigma B factor antagonist
MGHDFSTKITQDGSATVVHVRGEIDMESCGRLRDAIEPFMGPHQSIVLDLSEVRFMDTTMITLLVQARGRLTADGGSLVLRNPSDVARTILTISGLQDLLDADAAEHPSGSE